MDVKLNEAPVISDISEFDRKSGSSLEKLIFNNRPLILIICLVLTVGLAFSATRIKLNASFDQMIPTHQPLIVNYLSHFSDLQSQNNAIQISVETNSGTIIDKHYLAVLESVSNEAYLLPGVNRPFMASLWTPQTKWAAVMPDGLDGGPVITYSYNGSPSALKTVLFNVEHSGTIGTLVANDFKSSIVFVPLMLKDNLSGQPLDYGNLDRRLEQMRAKYDRQGVTLHIIGFPAVVGGLINGIAKILAFFVVSILIATLVLFWYTRCLRSTALVVTASLVAVTWQIGILPLLGLDLTPYSVLVPFLVFAIGMSHGAQKMNGVMQDIGRGTHRLIAARYTFRRLFLAGFAALVCDATSFGVLMTIRIGAIQQLAAVAMLGVAILIFTNLIVVPVVLSYIGVDPVAARRSLEETPTGKERRYKLIWSLLDRFTQRPYAIGAILIAVLIGGLGWNVGRHVQVGDIFPGAPEFRQSSIYNQDNAYILDHYAVGNDSFIILVNTKPEQCLNYKVMQTLSRLSWTLQQLPTVKSTDSVASLVANLSMFLNEESPKWYGVADNQPFLDDMFGYMPYNLVNFSCSFTPIYVALSDHKANTLSSVLDTAQRFIDAPENQSNLFKISLAGGNAGIDTATNIVIEHANSEMLFLIYAVVIIFCYITFRSWRAVVCAVLPLVLTSLLAQALMVWLGIGVKVATLPALALGVGIGVDYALYVLSILLKQMRMGNNLSDAYYLTLTSTGKVVLLTGFTLAAGVGTWVFAPIKFQADMGLLLSFMFLWNMLGAMILLPALAHFLLPARLFVYHSEPTDCDFESAEEMGFEETHRL